MHAEQATNRTSRDGVVTLREPKDLAKPWDFNPGTAPLPLDQDDWRLEGPCNHNWPIHGLIIKLNTLEVPISPKPGNRILNRPLGSTPRIIQLSLGF